MRLTDNEKRAIDALPTIGYWSALGGVELKRIEHGIEDYCICRVGSWKSKPTYHRVRVQYPNVKRVEPRPFIVINYEKFYLEDCIRSQL